MAKTAFTPDTQQGATVTMVGIGSSFWDAAQSIPAVKEAMPTIDATNLGTTGQRKFIAGDLTDVAEFTVEYQHDGYSVMPVIGQPYLVTITAPLQSGASVAEKWAGSCICTGIEASPFVGGANALQTSKISWKPDGGQAYFGSAWARTVAS